ncbi:MAG TPA: hypothetical protein VFF68_04850, partial [Anaerolineaceae bacterium]|nr:hypothetical protein [Anaerolineaceae bacterium]
MKSIFHGLRGKLTLTYTLVTVLALLALEALAITLVVLASSLNRMDQREYLNDAIYLLYPQASDFLQPGKEDLPGLQAWLEGVAASGYASLPPQYAFDSPAAVIVPDDPLLVVSPDLTVLAQAPLEPNSLVGRRYTPGAEPGAADILSTALDNWTNPLDLSTPTVEGNIRLAVPIRQADRASPVVGVLLLTIEPAPPMILNTLPVYLGWIAVTGLLLLMAVAPFGALFGYIMSRGLTRRLTALSQAADAWSEGD